MSSPPIPEARIVFKATGGVMSSREMQNVAQIIGHEIMYESKPRYPPRQDGSTIFYDFECLSFRVTERNGVLTVSVGEDRTNQAKRLVVGGVVVAEGEDLGFRMFQVNGRLSAKNVVASSGGVRLVEGKFNILSIVDIYGWAWDIASRELFDSLPKRYVGHVLDRNDFLSLDLDAGLFDVVLVYTFMDNSVLARLKPENTVVCIAGWEGLYERLMRPSLQRFKYFGACNGDIAELIKRMLPDRTVWVLSHGVDTERFKPADENPTGFVVGWVGNKGREIKRFPLAERAVEMVGGAELRVSGLVGTPEYRSHGEMPKFYQGLSCLLVTSSTEAHSLVVYEALASGLPVVSTCTGDTDENVVDGVNGFLLPIDCNVDQIVPLLIRLRDDPSLRTMMGGEARRTVLEKWTWNRVAESYVDAFRTIMGISTHYKRRIGFLWWYNPYTATETSVLTIQRKALEEMGVEVETFNIETVFTREEELRRLNDVDLVFTGVMPLVLEDERFKLIKSPVYFNIDGYGSTTFHEGYFNPLFPKLTEKAALVTFLDMNVAEEFKASGLRFDWGKLFWMPNGAEDLKPLITNSNEFRKPDEIHVGSLMKDNEYKKPWIYLEATRKLGRPARFTYPILNWKAFLHDYGELGWPRGAFGLPSLLEYEDGYVDRSEGGKPFDRKHGDILKVTRARLQGLPNVDFLQHMPYRKVPNYVSGCDIFCHYSHGDAFAKTVTEAFSLGKAPICSDVIRIQGIAEKHLGEARDAIGLPLDEAYGKVKPLLGSGRHLVVIPRGRSDLCAEALRWALDNKAEYDARGEAARSWSLAWINWQLKWKLIFELAEARKII